MEFDLYCSRKEGNKTVYQKAPKPEIRMSYTTLILQQKLNADSKPILFFKYLENIF